MNILRRRTSLWVQIHTKRLYVQDTDPLEFLLSSYQQPTILKRVTVLSKCYRLGLARELPGVDTQLKMLEGLVKFDQFI